MRNTSPIGEFRPRLKFQPRLRFLVEFRSQLKTQRVSHQIFTTSLFSLCTPPSRNDHTTNVSHNKRGNLESSSSFGAVLLLHVNRENCKIILNSKPCWISASSEFHPCKRTLRSTKNLLYMLPPVNFLWSKLWKNNIVRYDGQRNRKY